MSRRSLRGSSRSGLLAAIYSQPLKVRYADLRRGFIDRLGDALGGSAWPGRLLAVPGKQEVDRTKADGF
jgi:hypothetical protein